MLKGLQSQLKETQKSIENIIKAIEQGMITPSTKEQLEALEADKTRIENGIMEESVAIPRITRDQVVYYLGQFRSGNATDPEYRKQLVEVFLNAIYVYAAGRFQIEAVGYPDEIGFTALGDAGHGRLISFYRLISARGLHAGADRYLSSCSLSITAANMGQYLLTIRS